MLTDEENPEKLHNELKWVSNEDRTFLDKLKSIGISGILVPLGCLSTVGILSCGIYNLFQKNSKKQQTLMRYRIIAQGITLSIAAFGVYHYPKL